MELRNNKEELEHVIKEKDEKLDAILENCEKVNS